MSQRIRFLIKNMNSKLQKRKKKKKNFLNKIIDIINLD